MVCLIGLCVGIVLAVPKAVFAGLSEWLLWGGVVTTIVAVVATFTPAAPVAPVLGVIEVVGIIGGVLTHPLTQGVPASVAKFEELDEKMMMTEFLLTDLATLDMPTGNDSQYTPLYLQANEVIYEFNEFRHQMEFGSSDTIVALELLDLSHAIDGLADQIQLSGLDMVVFADEANAVKESIEFTGLPSFELDHLVDSGYSDDAIATFTELHSDTSPDGTGLIEPMSLSGAVRNAADRFVDIAIDLTQPEFEEIPVVKVIDVIIATPR